MGWPAESQLQILVLYRGKQKRQDDRFCTVPSNRTLPGTLTNEKNSYDSYVTVPSYNVVSPGNACMLAAVQLLMRVSQPHLPSMPAMYIQRACNEGKGLPSYLQLLEIVMKFASRPDVLPKNEKYNWLRNIRHFRIVTGEKAREVFEKLTNYKSDNSGAFCFYDKEHAYCASSAYFLTKKGKADTDHIYAFNVSNIGSTTSRKARSWFHDKFTKDNTFEILYMDNIEPSLSKTGDYIWNEGMQLFQPNASKLDDEYYVDI